MKDDWVNEERGAFDVEMHSTERKICNRNQRAHLEFVFLLFLTFHLITQNFREYYWIKYCDTNNEKASYFTLVYKIMIRNKKKTSKVMISPGD